MSFTDEIAPDQFLIDAYLGARKAKITITAQSTTERAGRYLLLSAARTVDGSADAKIAVKMALYAEEQDAAMRIFDLLLGSENPVQHPDARTSTQSPQVKGEIHLDF